MSVAAGTHQPAQPRDDGITFASKILLLHLGVVNAVLCLFYLMFYAASLLRLLPVALDAMDVACLLFGLCFNTLHSIALWTLCALNFDRYFAIATPLHYGTFINTKKVRYCVVCGKIFPCSSVLD
uniref:G-protein coupled receptors family 1 profile domain-containing protein n=1 Tax=Anopheles maculatus TaxID=74869 RepID=A0A182SUN3_9DIPT